MTIVEVCDKKIAENAIKYFTNPSYDESRDFAIEATDANGYTHMVRS